MLVTLSPIVTLLRLRQPLNTLCSMVVTAAGMSMPVSDVQLAKALVPIVETFSLRNVTVSSAVQPWNVVPWMVVVSPPISTVFNPLMLWKGCSALVYLLASTLRPI